MNTRTNVQKRGYIMEELEKILMKFQEETSANFWETNIKELELHKKKELIIS